MNVLTTRELKERLNELQGQTVMLQGWIRNHRKQKNMGFIDFFDGTCFKNPQVVYDNTIEDYAAIQALHVGAAITVTGKVVPSYKDPTTPEVQAIAIHLEGDCPEDYPLQPKRHSVEYLREIAYLRPRTRLFQAVFRVRSVATHGHSYLLPRPRLPLCAYAADYRQRRGGRGQHLHRDDAAAVGSRRTAATISSASPPPSP